MNFYLLFTILHISITLAKPPQPNGHNRLQEDYIHKVYLELNRHRLFNLSYNHKQQDILDAKAKDLERSYNHSRTGFYGEVLTIVASPEKAIESFWSSPPHKKILKDQRAKSICIGLHQGKYKGVDVWFVVIRTYD